MGEAREARMGLDQSGGLGRGGRDGWQDVQEARYTGCSDWLSERLGRHPRL